MVLILIKNHVSMGIVEKINKVLPINPPPFVSASRARGYLNIWQWLLFSSAWEWRGGGVQVPCLYQNGEYLLQKWD